MNTEDILRMAREAGLFEDGKFFVLEHSELERFFKTAYEAGAAAEREACLDCIRPNATPMEIAAAIRARGHAQVADRLARHGIPFPGEDNGRDPV